MNLGHSKVESPGHRQEEVYEVVLASLLDSPVGVTPHPPGTRPQG